MTDSDTPLSAFPNRPFRLEELESLEDHDRITTIIHDKESGATRSTMRISNCVLVTTESVHAVVYDDDSSWRRVAHQSRPEADLTAAYDAIRAARQRDRLFERAPQSVDEAIFYASSDDDAETYAAGDEFDCPVCGGTHVVRREDGPNPDDSAESTPDLGVRYVECPDARAGRLFL